MKWRKPYEWQVFQDLTQYLLGPIQESSAHSSQLLCIIWNCSNKLHPPLHLLLGKWKFQYLHWSKPTTRVACWVRIGTEAKTAVRILNGALINKAGFCGATTRSEVRVSFPSISWRKMGWFGSVEWLLGFVFVTSSHVLHCPTKRSWKIQQILCAGGGWEAGCWARRGTLSFFWVYSIHMLYTFLCKFCMHPNHLSEAGQKQIYFDYLMVPLWFRHRSM